mmetsp:Transcript_30896/g.78846  ORF Transcript_30896/g.78846 Transcript_30896/m.78846 type:complete len:250 (-) Transcript_30896:185-934(-)
MGAAPPRVGLRAGHQRPGDALLHGLPLGAPAARPAAHGRGRRRDPSRHARAGGGGCLLVPLQAARLDTGPLHLRAAGHTADGLQAQGDSRAHRRAAARAPGRAGALLHPVRLPLDELPVDAGALPRPHLPSMGHLPRGGRRHRRHQRVWHALPGGRRLAERGLRRAARVHVRRAPRALVRRAAGPRVPGPRDVPAGAAHLGLVERRRGRAPQPGLRVHVPLPQRAQPPACDAGDLARPGLRRPTRRPWG